MSHRPRLLFLAQTLPFPPDGGVAIRTYNVLRLLARDFDITGLCFYRRASRPTPTHVASSLAGLREHAVTEAFPIAQEHSRSRLLLDHARSVLTGRSYTVFAYESIDFRSRLRSLLRTDRFDIIHLDSLDLSSYVDDLPAGVPVVCAHHNVESILLARRAEAEASAVRRAYLTHQARLMAREEKTFCPRFALNTAVSNADRDIFKNMIPDARFVVVPNGVDVETFSPSPTNGPLEGLVFVGGYTWFPNRDALVHFCADILPHLRARGFAGPVHWVGRAPETVQEEYASRHQVQLTGYVDTIQPYMDAAACYIVPLRVGGGTRLKILDAWAMGKAVVSTSVGCEGLDARDGDNILIRDDPAEFANAVLQVLENVELRGRLGRNARRTAEDIYSWDVIGETMIGEYRGLLKEVGARTGARP